MRGSARSKQVAAALGTVLALTLGVPGLVHARPTPETVGSSVSPITVATSAAAASVVTGKRPTLRVNVRPRKVALLGRARLRTQPLVVQRARVGTPRWLVVKRVRSRRHAFSATVPRLRVTSRYRVIDPRTRATSPVRVVRPGSAQAPKRPASSDACGLRPKKPDGTLWACTLVDEFDGPGLDETVWVPQTNGYFTGVKDRRFACYTRDNVGVANGHLRLRLRKREQLFECPGFVDDLTTRYTAGSVTTYHTFAQRYGRFEARMRNTAAVEPGLHEAFWLWPDDREVPIDWPSSGEIDVAETYSVRPNLAIPFLHYANPDATPSDPEVLTGPHTNTAWNCAAKRGAWNTYRLVWGPSRIQVFVNNKLCVTNSSGDQAFREKYILALTQAIGDVGNEATEDTPMPATTEVDWVRVWK